MNVSNEQCDQGDSCQCKHVTSGTHVTIVSRQINAIDMTSVMNVVDMTSVITGHIGYIHHIGHIGLIQACSHPTCLSLSCVERLYNLLK